MAQVKKYTDSFRGGVADSCWAYAVGNVSQEVKNLMAVTKECLYRGIEKAVVGNRIGDIGAAIQEYAEVCSILVSFNVNMPVFASYW